MKKLTLTLLMAFTIIAMANAQSATGTGTYNKLTQAAVVNEFPFEPNTTEDAIVAKMKALGYSSKSSKGYDVFKGVKIAELGPDTYDLYFSIEKKSKKEKDRSTVILLLSKGYENFTNETSDPALFANAKKFVDNLVANAAATDLEKQIADQEDVIKKADKKYNTSVDEATSLEKKKRQIEQDIADNIKDQANKKAEADAQRQVLKTLKDKRKA